MLTASSINELISDGHIDWAGDLRGDALLLTLGAPLQPLLETGSAAVVDLADQASIDRLYQPPSAQWKTFDLSPGRMALCHVDQPLRLGPRHTGAIGTLSHLARVGLATHVTSPWVLPGWNGHITLELLNVGPAPLRVHYRMPVARLLLFATGGPLDRAHTHPFYGFGAHLGSRYADEFPVHTYQE